MKRHIPVVAFIAAAVLTLSTPAAALPAAGAAAAAPPSAQVLVPADRSAAAFSPAFGRGFFCGWFGVFCKD